MKVLFVILPLGLAIKKLNVFTILCLVTAEGGFGEEGLDGDILGGDEEGGGWDVGDEDLVLPPDLVSLCKKLLIFSNSI